MTSFVNKAQAIGKGFIDLDRGRHLPNVLAVLLGGSKIYSSTYEDDESVDWDGALLVSTKIDVCHLVNVHRRDLMAMLDITQEEDPDFAVPPPSSPESNYFDAVRFSGFTALGLKRSVKILSVEYFSEGRTTLNIISYKDKRLFEAEGSCLPATSRCYRVQQATRLLNLTILHDQWVYTTLETSSHAHKPPSAVFGVTADLIVSGMWLRGGVEHGTQIKKKILACYFAATGQVATVCAFARSPRFSTEYTEWLRQELSTINPPDDVFSEQMTCSCQLRQGKFLFGATSTVPGHPSEGVAVRADFVPQQALDWLERGMPLNRSEILSSVFTSNSLTFTVEVSGDAGTHQKLFCKRSRHQKEEVKGALLAASFFPHVQVPSITTSGDMLYLFFEGATESQLRLSYIQNGRRDWQLVEKLLYTELRKSEDMLRAYRMSLAIPKEHEHKVSESSIQRFFHSRLEGNRRLYELYGNSIALLRRTFDISEFLNFSWEINGMEYPSLRELFTKALHVLQPNSAINESCPTIFGLGDAHGANIMVGSDVLSDNSHDILYIDYEVAGYHPVMLDLAKPLYNDVFFDIFYLDILSQVTDAICRLEDGRLSIDLTLSIDDLTQAIFDIKKRYLLQPLRDFIESRGASLDQHVPLLSYALLLSATLTRNFGNRGAVILQNMAIGILLSQATGWDELYSCFSTLGFGQ